MDGTALLAPPQPAPATALAQPPDPTAGMPNAATIFDQQRQRIATQGAAQDESLQRQTAIADQGAAEQNKLLAQMPGAPPDPQLQAAPKKPDLSAEQKENAETFMAISAVVAGIAGALSRNHATTALNAFGAALKGAHQGQMEQAQEAHQQWKDETDAVISNNEKELKQYEAILSNRKLTTEQISAQMTVAASQNQNKIMLESARSKNLETMGGQLDSLDDAQVKYIASVDKMNQEHEKAEAEAQQKKDEMNARLAEKGLRIGVDGKTIERDPSLPGTAKTPTAWGAAYQAEVQRRIDAGEPPMGEQDIVRLKNSLNTPRSGSAIAVQKYMEEGKDLNGGKGRTSADVQKFLAQGSAMSAAQRSLAAGPMGLQLKSLGVATDHLTTLRDLSDAFNGGDEKTIAAAKAAWEREFGNPAPANEDLAAQFVAPELIKAIEGTPGGVSERDEMATAFKAARGHANVQGAINTAFALMGGQMNGMKNQIVKVDKLMSPEEFDDMIPSTALDAMQKHQTKSFSGGGTRVKPSAGAVEDGFKFNGGDPSDANNWEKVQ